MSQGSQSTTSRYVYPRQGRDHFDGDIVLTKMPALVVPSGTGFTIAWVPRGNEGRPFAPQDGETPTYTFTLLGGANQCLAYANGERDEGSGEVRGEFDKAIVPGPGIYRGGIAVLDADENTILQNSFQVIIEASILGSDCQGPLSIPEVRLFLRDNGSGDNELLDHVDFDEAEIALSMRLPIDQWNETPPNLGRQSTQAFPYRYHWLKATCGHLFLIAAEHYRRNRLQYSTAGGTQVDDKNKANEYEQKAQQYLDEWKTFIRQKKIELNMADGWGGIGSSYGYH